MKVRIPFLERFKEPLLNGTTIVFIIIAAVAMAIPVMWLAGQSFLSYPAANGNLGNSTLPSSPFQVIYDSWPILSLAVVVGIGAVAITTILSFGGGMEAVKFYPTEPKIEEPHEMVETPKETVYELHCPKCSAPLDFDEGSTRTKCEYCGARVYRRLEEESD
jgi:DNA-directed RNA polymerase subunit RPC12/RpoP